MPGVAVEGGLGDTGGLYDDVVDRVHGGDDERFDYVFRFAQGDAYGRAAQAFIDANYGDYRQRTASSLEAMFEILHRELAGRRGAHVGHIILVSHATISAPDDAEARDGATTAGEMFIAPWRGSEERLSAQSLAELQHQFREGLHARFRRQRAAVVGEAIDENTMIEIRGCRIGQSAETMTAIRDLFGGAAEVRAPTGYQGYGRVPWDESRVPLAQAVEVLIAQGSVPASTRTLAPAEQRAIVEGLVAEHGGLPTQHFIPDGTGDHAAFERMETADAVDQLLRPDAGDHATRDHVDLPGMTDEWRYARGHDDDADLERLPREEIERRARTLLARYRPEDAPMLARLRDAWLVVSLGDDTSGDDPIAGLPPVDVFGEPGVIDRDAARARGRHDRFEEADIEATAPTARQRAALDGGPDVASLDAVPAAPAEAPAEAASAVEPRARPRRRRPGRPSAAAPAGIDAGEVPLQLVAASDGTLVFNREAFRSEVIAFLWGDSYTPSAAELSGGIVQSRIGELIVPSQHWTIARTTFAAGPEMYERMRPEVRARILGAPDRERHRALTRPHWIPQDVWREFMATSTDQMRRYRDRSPIRTDIVMIRRDGLIAAYYEAQEREEILYQQMDVLPPDRLHAVLGLTTVDQDVIHLLALANDGYNRYMWREVSGGVDPYTAHHAYPEAVRWGYIQAFVAAVGFMGSMAPSLAE